MSEDVKDIIKRAAIKLFGQNGFHGTSVRQVSNEANVNIASISYHFGSKDGLLEELFRDLNNEEMQEMIVTLQPISTAEEFSNQLMSFTRQFIENSLKESAKSEMIFRNFEHFGEYYPKLFETTLGRMHKTLLIFLESAAKLDIIRSDVPPVLIGQMFMSSLTDIIRNRKFRKKLQGFAIEDPKTIDNYVNALMTCFLNGVKKNEI